MCLVAQVLLQQIQGILGGLNEDERGLVLHLLEDARKLSGEGGLFTELVVYDLLFGYNDPLLVYIIKDIEALPDVLGDWVKKLKTFAKTINPLFGLEVISFMSTVRPPNKGHTLGPSICPL